MNKLIYRLIYLLLSLFWLLTACEEKSDENPAPDPSPAELKVIHHPEPGKVIADGNGQCLYFFAKDVDGIANCDGPCGDNWLVFFKKDLLAASGIDKDEIGEIFRPDSQLQNTFKDYPLDRLDG